MSGKPSRMVEALKFGVMALFGLLILAPAIQAVEESFSFRRFGTVRL